MQFVVVVPDRSLKLKWILSSSSPTPPPLRRPVALTAVDDGSSFHVPIIRLQLSSISLSLPLLSIYTFIALSGILNQKMVHCSVVILVLVFISGVFYVPLFPPKQDEHQSAQLVYVKYNYE